MHFELAFLGFGVVAAMKLALKCSSPTFCASRPRQLPSQTQRHAHGVFQGLVRACTTTPLRPRKTPHRPRNRLAAWQAVVVPEHSCGSGRRIGAPRQGRAALVFLEVEMQLTVYLLVMLL